MMDVRYPLSLRNVDDLLHGRGIDITHETVRCLWNRFGTILAAPLLAERRKLCAARSMSQQRISRLCRPI